MIGNNSDCLRSEAGLPRWRKTCGVPVAEVDFGAGVNFDLQPIMERIGIEKNVIAVHHVAIENLDGERNLNHPLNRALPSPSRAHLLLLTKQFEEIGRASC